MNLGSLTIVFALFWAAVTGVFSGPNLVLGGVVSAVAIWIMFSQQAMPTFLLRWRRGIQLAGLFLYELVLSAFRVAVLVLRPDMNSALRPAIFAFPLKAKSDIEITLLANLITLTPGTLSVDVADDRSVIYVHALQIQDKDQAILDIAEGFEKKIIEVFE